MEHKNLTMYAAFKEAANDFPRGVAVFYQGKKIRFSTLLKRIDKMADILVGTLNIKAGDTVLLSEPNIPATLIIFYALNKIGAITNFVHPFTPFNQLKKIYKDTHCKYAFLFEQRIAKEVRLYRDFSSHIYVARIEDDLPLIKKITYHLFYNVKIRHKLGKYPKFDGFKYVYQLKPNKKVKAKEVSNDSSKVAILLHSGSTTGAPKTICLNNDSFNFISDHACEFLSVEPEFIRGKAMLSVLPSFHGFGLCMTMHAPMCNRFACALVPKFTVKDTLKVMKHMKLASICGVPGMYEKLIEDPKFVKSRYLKNFVVCFCGGDQLPLPLKDKFDKVMRDGGSKCQVFEGYGLTEAIAVNCVNTFTHNKAGSIGYPASGVEFVILDENENKLPPNSIGEIAFKSGAVMLHYFNDEAATKATFSKEGYLKTGDLGYIDEDGFLFFKGRKKRVVKVSGVGVFPSEVEQLIESVHNVKLACVISIPDEKLGHALKAIVVAKYMDEEGMKKTILDACRNYLIRWAVPKEIEFRDELPLTPLNKVDFKKLQEEEDKKYSL